MIKCIIVFTHLVICSSTTIVAYTIVWESSAAGDYSTSFCIISKPQFDFWHDVKLGYLSAGYQQRRTIYKHCSFIYPNDTSQLACFLCFEIAVWLNVVQVSLTGGLIL